MKIQVSLRQIVTFMIILLMNHPVLATTLNQTVQFMGVAPETLYNAYLSSKDHGAMTLDGAQRATYYRPGAGPVAQLYQYKGNLNTKKLHYAGLFDFGNDVIGEGHEFTRIANFIEWFGDIEPAVFFSNGPSDLPQINEKRVPLSSNRRFMGIQWGPRTLNPGQTETYPLAIGMAVHNPKDGFPMKPDVDLKNFP